MLSKFQKLIYVFFLVGCGTLLPACAWQAATDWEMGVFSDDQEGIAMVRRFYQKKQEFAHEREKNYSFEVWTSARGTPNTKTKLSGIIEGRPLQLFYFRAENYVLVGKLLGKTEQEPQTRIVEWSKVKEDGSETVVANLSSNARVFSLTEGDSPLVVIPSPDGGTLAKLAVSSAGEVEVTFLNATDLSITGGPHSLSIAEGVRDAGALKPGWLVSGGFMVRNEYLPGDKGYWLFEGGSAPSLTTSPGKSCLSPPTTSSEWSPEGLHVQCTPEGEVVFETDAGFSKFGCE